MTDEWKIDWYECWEGDKFLWRAPRSIGPIGPAHNHWAGPYLECEEADAILAAAAPELLEALKEALDMPMHSPVAFRQWIDIARAAIEKASAPTH